MKRKKMKMKPLSILNNQINFIKIILYYYCYYIHYYYYYFCCCCLYFYCSIILPSLLSSASLLDGNQFFSPSHYYDIISSSLTTTECDQIFISKTLNQTYGKQNGTFVGPSFKIPFPTKTLLLSSNDTTNDQLTDNNNNNNNVNRYTRQCIYTFIAGPNERVRVSFTKFSLRSELPECLDEYVDIYAELKYPDTDLLSTPFGGRYCDLVIPHDRISLFQTIVISFYTAKLLDGTILNGSNIFEGNYEFINATPYIAGTPMPNEICSYTIHSEIRREGEFMTPTYPGVYPKNITCYYLFKGVKGQRVKLEFMDFDLFYGGSHCPYDYVKIYDGDTIQSPLINIYCGQQRQLFVFSSGTNLLVQFTTLKRISSVNQNRGFSGYYEFSEKFVNLGFIINNENSEHIRGTECDQKIFSRKESNGTIYAPNYPFLYHSNIMCKYFLYGLQDAQNLERINFHFEMLQIPTKDVNECTDAYIRLYTQMQAMEEFDYVFCGETIPPPVVSDGPLLLVVFNSGSTQGQGFKAHYWFETDYKIMGTQASPDQCHFSYVSSGSKNGDFNSPRHPSNYPSNTYCVYEFFGEPDEQIKLVFNQFKFSDNEVLTQGIPGYNEKCTHDWIEIYSINNNINREKFYGRFCGYTAPGPMLTEIGVNQIKVIMNTDDNEVSSGFSATYKFDRSSDRIKDCGGNFTNLNNGIIQTPNYPNNYPATMQVCNWFITVRNDAKVLLYFDEFSVEGDPPSRGCPGAIVRVWVDVNEKPIELCGEKLNENVRQYISNSNVMRITFLTAQKAVGALGFSAIWTEVNLPSSKENNESQIKNVTKKFGPCTTSINPQKLQQELQQQKLTSVSSMEISLNNKPYQCQKHGYCISNKLRCNGIKNCGFDDESDENDCIHEVKIDLIDLVGGMTGLLICIFFTIGVICLTIILIINWFKKSPNDEKNIGQIVDKTCQHYFTHPTTTGLTTNDCSSYYQPDLSTTLHGTPHRLIDVMTVSSSSTTPGGGISINAGVGNLQTIKNVRWPSSTAINSDEQQQQFSDTMFIDPTNTNEPIRSTNSPPIPPPPPPPSQINRSLLNLRQSSLINFNQFIDNNDNIGSNTINCNTFNHYQPSNHNNDRSTMTMNRQTLHHNQRTDSRTSTFTTATIPSSNIQYTPYCNTLPGGGLNKLLQQQQQQIHCQSTLINNDNNCNDVDDDNDNDNSNNLINNNNNNDNDNNNNNDNDNDNTNNDDNYLLMINNNNDKNDLLTINGDESDSLNETTTATPMISSLRKYQISRLHNNNNNYDNNNTCKIISSTSTESKQSQQSLSLLSHPSSITITTTTTTTTTTAAAITTTTSTWHHSQSHPHPHHHHHHHLQHHHQSDVFTTTPNINYQQQQQQQHYHHQQHHNSSLIVDD